MKSVVETRPEKSAGVVEIRPLGVVDIRPVVLKSVRDGLLNVDGIYPVL